LRGKIFDDVGTIEHNAVKEVLMIPKTEFERCFQHWQV
jgi:hypothetical protein